MSIRRAEERRERREQLRERKEQRYMQRISNSLQRLCAIESTYDDTTREMENVIREKAEAFGLHVNTSCLQMTPYGDKDAPVEEKGVKLEEVQPEIGNKYNVYGIYICMKAEAPPALSGVGPHAIVAISEMFKSPVRGVGDLEKLTKFLDALSDAFCDRGWAHKEPIM